MDKLTDFGHTFQIKSISALMKNQTFLEQIHDILDEKHYDSDSLKWVVKECKKYYDEYISKTNYLKIKYPDNVKIWNLLEFNKSKTKNEILDFISYDKKRIVDKNFKRNTKIKSQVESILNKIKEWF